MVALKRSVLFSVLYKAHRKDSQHAKKEEEGGSKASMTSFALRVELRGIVLMQI